MKSWLLITIFYSFVLITIDSAAEKNQILCSDHCFGGHRPDNPNCLDASRSAQRDHSKTAQWGRDQRRHYQFACDSCLQMQSWIYMDRYLIWILSLYW